MKRPSSIWMIRCPPSAGPLLGPPLGFMYLASALRRAGYHDIRILDMGPERLSLEWVGKEVHREKPNFVFVTLMTIDLPAAAKLCKAIRAASPKSVIVVGGPHPTGDPQGCLNDLPEASVAVAGEGEEAAVEVVEAFENGLSDLSGILGVAWRSPHGEVVTNPPRPLSAHLDDLWPAYDLIKIDSYFRYPRLGYAYKHRRYMALFTSRGCPFKCAFCHRTFGKRWRGQSAGRIVEEMAWLYRIYGIREFQFFDDVFNLDHERVLGVCEGILQRGLKVHLNFPIGLRADILRPAEIEALSRAGTWRVYVAPETGSERIQRLIGKRCNLAKVKAAVEEFERRGVFTSGYFMIGFPGETVEEIDQTIKWAVESRLHTAAFSRVIPLPGTVLSSELRHKSDGLSPFDYMMTGTRFNLSPLPDSLLEAKQREAVRRFYGDPKRLFRIARDIPKPLSLWPAYAWELWTQLFLGSHGLHLLGKLSRPSGLREAWIWYKRVWESP